VKIAVLANTYGSLSETFVRREVDALAARGHELTVFTLWPFTGPPGPPPTVPVEKCENDAVRRFEPEVLYASLGLAAHHRAFDLSQRYNIPVCYRIWSGYDAFVRVGADFYPTATAHARCLGVIVEDEWMRKYAETKMGVRRDALSIVPNSIDVERFCPSQTPHDGFHVLAVARFVEKKGLIHLVHAWNGIAPRYPAAELMLVGYGPEEDALRGAAGERVRFLPPVPESELPALYQSADVFVAPCIQAGDGDADGIPTTVLEAMACGLPVIMSDTPMARCYIAQLDSGILAQGLIAPIEDLITDPILRQAMGRTARGWAETTLDIRDNIQRIESVLTTGSRAARWQAGVQHLTDRRQHYTPSQLLTYERLNRESLSFLQIDGDVLDVGCGDASMRVALGDRIRTYFGIDINCAATDFVAPGRAESLFVVDRRFDTVLMHSVLQHVEDPKAALGEARRVLRPDGKLALNVCVDDPNPLFIWWWSAADVLDLVRHSGFLVRSHRMLENRILLVNAERA
jgi:glycosyltransferase involved in cell wall biosynthesis/2-polyprenyl-3-methyl-5-hydroxy-6-metoxy-1,4-benzoquinol methylase